MRLTKIRLVISVLVVAGLLGAIYSYNTHHLITQNDQENTSYTSGGSLQVSSSPSSQTISLYSPSQENSVDPTLNAQANRSMGASSPNQSTTSSGGSAHYAQDVAIINGLSTQTTSMPNFNYGRPSPALNVPPSPNCGSNSDSSGYADCMDGYCRTYPGSSACLGGLQQTRH